MGYATHVPVSGVARGEFDGGRGGGGERRGEASGESAADKSAAPHASAPIHALNPPKPGA